MRRCKDCGKLKPLGNFYLHCRRSGHQAGYRFYSSYCHKCDNKRSIKYARSRRLRKRYGIADSDYEAMLAAQGGGCRICGRQNEAGRNWLAVDHDHCTGTVRGLLCDRCNRTLGSVKDSVALLRRMIAYLGAE